MTDVLRSTGLPALGELPWGTHSCVFYATTNDLIGLIVPFFQAGLKANEFCFWIVGDPSDLDGARQELIQSWPEAAALLRAGALELVHQSEWYFQDGRFAPERILPVLREKLTAALDRGCSGIRLVGDGAWLRSEFWPEFLAYERQLNEALAGLRLLVLCAYPLPRLTAEQMLEVAESHELVAARRHGQLQVFEAPPLKQAKSQIEKLNRALEGRIEQRTGQLQELNGELRRLTARLDSAREEEGARIARELHDQLGSALTSLRWEVEGLARVTSEPEREQKMASMLKLIDATVAVVRRIASELRPQVLDDCGVVAAVEWQARQFEARSGLACQCHILVDEVHLTRDQGTAVFRILQEALTNVLRHAEATQVTIAIREDGGDFVLEVRDNGVGLPDGPAHAEVPLGLVGMRERAQLAGGSVSIAGASPGPGTVVTLRIPQ